MVEWLIVILLILILALLAVLLLRRNSDGSAEVCEKGFAASRSDLNENFSRSRLELQQYFNMQQEMVKSSFAEFMKFLQEFRDAVRQADAQSAEKLAGALQNYGDRTEKMHPEEREAAMERLGLNEPIHVQYVKWLRRTLDVQFFWQLRS